jgi:cytidine deaminase
MKLSDDTIKELIAAAIGVRQCAYAPYSQFKVGAALLAESGEIYSGCNVENASYGATICAERAAVVKAVSAGEQAFQAIALVYDQKEMAVPCGVCRQVLSEFNMAMTVIMANTAGEYESSTMQELLPCSFKKSSLK